MYWILSLICLDLCFLLIFGAFITVSFFINKKYHFIALDSTQSELFDVKAKFDEMAAARYYSIIIFKFYFPKKLLHY